MHFVGEFFIYYVKGRIYEWMMAFVFLFAGLELLIWEQFVVLYWIVISQKWLGTAMLFTGWIRLSALMFNGQLLFGRRFGYVVRASCAVISAVVLAQFTFALISLSISQGYPSIDLPLLIMLVVAELLVAYSVGAEWKK